MPTRAPRPPKASAIARPMPELAPVTSTVFFARSFMVLLDLYDSHRFHLPALEGRWADANLCARAIGDAGLAMDTEPDAHLTVGDGDQRVVGTGERAPGERDTHRAGAIVRSLRDPFNVVQAHAFLGGGTGNLEYRKGAGDASAPVALGRRRGRDVIGHGQDAYVDSFGAHPLGCLPEMKDVTGVVAKAEQYAASAVRRFQHGVHLRGGGGGEDVAARSTVRQAGPNPAGEGGIVASAPAYHHGDLTGCGPRGPSDTAVDLSQVATVRGHQALECLVREVCGVVNEVRHHVTPERRELTRPVSANGRRSIGILQEDVSG